jgi:hypothetical protein
MKAYYSDAYHPHGHDADRNDPHRRHSAGDPLDLSPPCVMGPASVGNPGAVGVTVLGTGHPPISHLVGAGAVEVEIGGLLRFCLGWVMGENAA